MGWSRYIGLVLATALAGNSCPGQAPVEVAGSANLVSAECPELPPGPWSTGREVEPDWFASVDIAIVRPRLDSFLTGQVVLGNDTTTVGLRNAALGTTVSPQIQLGAFRQGPGSLELLFTYRFLVSEGRDLTFSPADGLTQRRSRANLQLFRLDLARDECWLGTETVLRWEAGLHLLAVFFDTETRGARAYLSGTNTFYGLGPRAGVSVARSVVASWGVFARVDGGLALGYNTTQRFVTTRRDADGDFNSGQADQEESNLGPSIQVQAGAEWKPNWAAGSRMRAGYQFDEWFNIGKDRASRGDLQAQGLFLSFEHSF